MKKHIFIGYIIGFISCCVILSLVLYVLSMPKKEEIKFMPIPEGFAVMIYDEEKQDYIESDGLPIGGYKLNSEKSYCTNGGTIDKYNTAKGSVEYSIDGTDECVIYLDINEAPKITLVSTHETNITATLTDDNGLSGYALTTSEQVPSEWNEISGTTYELNTTVIDYGTYYLWTKDVDGSISNKIISSQVRYYAFGTYESNEYPTTTTNYTTLNKNVFIRDDTPDEITREVCIIRTEGNPGLHCFQSHNWEVEQQHLQEVFSDVSCVAGSYSWNGNSYVNCDASDFGCYVHSIGAVSCYDSTDSCDANDDGSTYCLTR